MINCKCVFVPESIKLKNGVATITLADNVLDYIKNCENQCVRIKLRTSIPTDSECNRVVVTDGTTDLDVACNNQYWRPTALHCNSTLYLVNKLDPEILVLDKVVR